MNSGDQHKHTTAKRCDGEQPHQLRGWVFEKVHIIPFEGRKYLVEGLKQLIIPVVNPQQVVCYTFSLLRALEI